MPTSPISFRMPGELRARLRRFAKARSLGEAEALRLALSEHLNEVDERRELIDAERWQLDQVLATLERVRRGEERVVSREEIEQLFRDAVARAAPQAR
ncbi:MAG: hypothetical protein AAB295_00690 [Chloroflexota bacterium]